MAFSKSFDDYVRHTYEKTPQDALKFKINLANAEMGAIVTFYRHKHHLTRRELSDRANVPQSIVTRIENGGESNVTVLVKLFSAMHEEIPWKSPREIINA